MFTRLRQIFASSWIFSLRFSQFQIWQKIVKPSQPHENFHSKSDKSSSNLRRLMKIFLASLSLSNLIKVRRIFPASNFKSDRRSLTHLRIMKIFLASLSLSNLKKVRRIFATSWKFSSRFSFYNLTADRQVIATFSPQVCYTEKIFNWFLIKT